MGGWSQVHLQQKECSSLLFLFYECMHDVWEEEGSGRRREGCRIAKIFIFEEKTKNFRIFSEKFVKKQKNICSKYYSEKKIFYSGFFFKTFLRDKNLYRYLQKNCCIIRKLSLTRQNSSIFLHIFFITLSSLLMVSFIVEFLLKKTNTYA